jgi:hypothetical protein
LKPYLRISLSTARSHKKLKKLLNTDPNICLIRTPAGIYRTHRSWFEQLCNLPWLVKVAPRIARVVDGYSVIIGEKDFYAYRTGRQPFSPSLPTFAQQVDQAWVYKVESRSLSPLEREQEVTRDYALFCMLEMVQPAG